WSACQKAPSVTVTWGWGNHDLLADLGNNAAKKEFAAFFILYPLFIIKYKSESWGDLHRNANLIFTF
ncbi:hypothetical protein ACW5WG_21015, partial [Aeromonas salmonicida]